MIMADDLEEKFSLALKNVGYISGNVKWMIGDDATKGFLGWFCKNIDSSNYLTEEELNEYKEIEASGCALDGEKLDIELENVIPGFDELDGNEKEVLQHLKQELARVESSSADMKNSLNELREDTSSLDSQINQLENKNKALENKVKKIQEIYYKNLADLDGSMRLLGENIKDVMAHCMKYKQKKDELVPKLIAEFSLKEYEKEKESVEHDIQKIIYELKPLDSQQRSPHSQIGEGESELDDLMKRSEITRLLRLKHGAQRQAFQYSLAWLKQHYNNNSFWASVSSPSSIWKLTQDAMQRCLLMKHELGKPEDIGDQISETDSRLWKKAKSGVQTYTLYQKEKLECLHHEITLLRRSQSLRATNDVIQAKKTLCSKNLVLMMLLGDEVYRVFNMSQIISSMTKAMEKIKIEGLQRMELMKSSTERRNCEIQRIQSYPLLHFLSSQLLQYSKTRTPDTMLSSTFSDHFVNDNICSILENLSRSSEDLKSELMRLEDTFLRNTNKHNLYLKSSYMKVLKLKRRIYNGSTSKIPVVCSYKGLSMLYSFDKKSDDLEVKIKKLKKISSSKKSEAFKIQRKLWVIFYTNPSMLKELLHKEENESLGDASYLSIS